MWRPSNRESEPAVNIWPSFVDVSLMMLLVLIIFIFAQLVSNTVAFKLARIRQKQAEIERLIKARVSAEILPDITFASDFKSQLITFSDHILFASGEAEIQPAGREVLDVIGSVLLGNSTLYEGLRIEGHTDRDPPIPGGRIRSNWDLSSRRATAVVEFFDEMGMDPEQLPMSAAGFSKYRPVDRGDSEAAYARNRRIEMIVVYDAD